MSDTTTTTNDDAIKEKKNKSAEKTDVGKFIWNFALSMIGIILFIIFGTSWLYISKLSSANIIPFDTKYEPYTCDENPDFGKNLDGPIKVPMNTITELDYKGLKFWGDPIGKWEQEATFASQDFIKSFKDSFISNLRKKTDNPASASNFDKCASILTNNVAAHGFWLYNLVSSSDFSADNIRKRFPNDSFKIIIYGMFGLMLFPFFWVWNGMASFWYTGKTLTCNEDENNPNDGGYLGGLFDGIDALKNGDSFVQNIWKAILRFFVWIPIWMIVIPILTMFVFPAYATFYPFFKMLFSPGYKLKEDGPFKNEKQKQSVVKFLMDFIKDNLIYKRILILVFTILNLFTCANTYLGAQYFGAVVLATVLAMYFGNIFVNTEPYDETMIPVNMNVAPIPVKTREDDYCEEFHKQVVSEWKRLKAVNEIADALIKKYKSSDLSDEEIEKAVTRIKHYKKHIIDQFKKTQDGREDPLTKTVDVFEPGNTAKTTCSYKELFDTYKTYIDITEGEYEKNNASSKAASSNNNSSSNNSSSSTNSSSTNSSSSNNNSNDNSSSSSSSSSPKMTSSSSSTAGLPKDLASGTNPLNIGLASGGGGGSIAKEKELEEKANKLAAQQIAEDERERKQLAIEQAEVARKQADVERQKAELARKEAEVERQKAEQLLASANQASSTSSTSSRVSEPSLAIQEKPMGLMDRVKKIFKPNQKTVAVAATPAAANSANLNEYINDRSSVGSRSANTNVLSEDYDKMLNAHSLFQDITNLPINYDNITISQLQTVLGMAKNSYIKRKDYNSPFSKILIANMREIMKQLYKKDPLEFAQYVDTNIESEIQDIQLEQATKNNSNSNSAAGGGGSNPPVVPGQTFENTLTGLVTDTKLNAAIKKINSNQKLDPNDLTDFSIDELKFLRTNADQHKNETIANGELKNQSITIDNALIIDYGIGVRFRSGQKGGAKNKTSKNRRQRFNIRLV